MVGTCYVLDVSEESFKDDKGVEHLYSKIKLLERNHDGTLGDMVSLTGPAQLGFEGMAFYDVTFRLSMRQDKPRIQAVALEKLMGGQGPVEPF